MGRFSKSFEVYMFPRGEITNRAFEKHGIDHQFLAGQSAMSKREGLKAFLRYLEELTEFCDEEIILVNHGNYSFGMKIFGENLARAGLSLYTRINDLPLLQCLKFFDSQKI